MAAVLYLVYILEDTPNQCIRYAYYCKAVLPSEAKTRMEQQWRADGKYGTPQDMYLTRSWITGVPLNQFIAVKSWRKGI